MSFDLERFRSAVLSPRQATLPVPDLAAWFADGETAEWTVRGLTGEEIARSNDNPSRAGTIAAAIQALANGAALKADQTEAMQTLLGYGADVPEDLAKRFDHLTYGSVAPAIDRPLAVRLFAAYPVVAYQLTNKILELTGMGPDLGKAPHSTAAPT